MNCLNHSIEIANLPPTFVRSMVFHALRKNGRVSITEKSLFGAKRRPQWKSTTETKKANTQTNRGRERELCVLGYWFSVISNTFQIKCLPSAVAHTYFIQKGIFVEKKCVPFPFKTKFGFLFHFPACCSSLIPSQKWRAHSIALLLIFNAFVIPLELCLTHIYRTHLLGSSRCRITL